MAEIAKLDWRSLMTAENVEAQDIAVLDAYFSHFAAPVWDDKRGDEKPMLCLKCGEPLTGFFASMFGKGGFEWGIAHGEGHCRNCGWPARAHHFIKDEHGESVATVRNLVLQYHPEFVEAPASPGATP